jgi:hypothetical protein
MSILEFNKASYGPLKPVAYYNNGDSYFANGSAGYLPNLYINVGVIGNVGTYANATTDRTYSGGSYYGVMDLTGNAVEPCVKLNYLNFNGLNGNGILSVSGNSDVDNWDANMIIGVDQMSEILYNYNSIGFRYVRSAE